MTAPAAPPLDCEEVVREIWDWLDDELPQHRWSAIQTHLATCTGCSEHVAFARSFLAKVSEPMPVRPDFNSLKERIRVALSSQKT